MGCFTSKLSNEEAVHLCKDRKNLIKQAVEQRRRFASGQFAYIQSLKGVSAALHDYIEGVEHSELSGEETSGFTEYENQKPTSMRQVIKDIDDQFSLICNATNEVSAMLEASRTKYSTTLKELSAMKMLNPLALTRSDSSLSSSSRSLINSASSRHDGNGSISDLSEESSKSLGCHKSTLDTLYVWENKLYNEVRSAERIQILYKKKKKQLRNQEAKGKDTSAMNKTRAALSKLDTQLNVSLRSVEALSERIETVRDQELQPQLLQLVQGLARMWKVMAECHQLQKQTLDEAKLLVAVKTPLELCGETETLNIIPAPGTREPNRLAHLAANLESELKNWRACFESWITSQRSYIRALTEWLLRCFQCNDMSKLPLSPCRSSGAPTPTPPIFGICIPWSRFLDDIPVIKVLENLDFFATGVGSIHAQQLKEDSRRQVSGGSKRFGCESGLLDVFESGGNMEVVEVRRLDELMNSLMAEVATKVLCVGTSVAMTSLTEFAIGSADKYTDLVNQMEERQAAA